MTRPSATVEWWWTSSARVAKRLSDVTYTCGAGGERQKLANLKHQLQRAAADNCPYFCPTDSTEPFHQRPCWSGSGRPSPHSEEKWTAVQGCSRSPWLGSCRWWGRRANTLQHCVTQVRGTSCASPDCWPAWCSWKAPNPGRSWSVLHSTLHSGCSPAHAVSHLATGRQFVCIISGTKIIIASFKKNIRLIGTYETGKTFHLRTQTLKGRVLMFH